MSWGQWLQTPPRRKITIFEPAFGLELEVLTLFDSVIRFPPRDKDVEVIEI